MDFITKPVIKDNQAFITFDDLTLESYQDFIKVKQLAKHEIKGNTAIFPASYVDDYWIENKKLPLPLTNGLFDYQKVMVQVGFVKQRYAFFADAGLGKTLVFGELIRQIYHSTTGKIVVCVPLNILAQFEEMMSFFPGFPEYDHLHNAKLKLDEWCILGDKRIAFINQEAFIRLDKPLKNVDAFFLDESSILAGGKDGNGKIAKNIIKCTQGIKFKYAASATPARNDRVEYAMHALFLEDVKSEKEFTSLFFVNKDGEYVLRKHAVRPFYNRLALWSIFIRNPAAYGFEDNLAKLKPRLVINRKVELTDEQLRLLKQYATKAKQAMLPGMPIQPTSMKQRTKFSQISKGFVYENGKVRQRVPTNKTEEIVKIITQENPGEQFIIATVYDEEGRIILERLLEEGLNVVHFTGKTEIEERAHLINEFRHGRIDGVISTPDIIGYGLNLQFCHIGIISGLNYSYEKYYQFIKRLDRYGQDEQVKIYHVYTDYEWVIIQSVLGKQKTAEADFAYQEKMYIDSLYNELKEFLTMEDYKPMVKPVLRYETVKTDKYIAYHGDSLEMLLRVARGELVEGLTKNSVDLSVFSPPFMGDIFTYSDDPADMGNTHGAGARGGLDEFMLQFRFFLKGMLAVTKPGRFMAMHLENVPLRKNLDGYIGVFPFVNRAIDIAMEEGWIMFGDPITILKNQQMQAITKKVSSLTMTSMEKDRTRICPAMNGYLVLFKKPGENQTRIADLARCKNCGWHGYIDELNGFDEKALRGYKSGDLWIFNFSCPSCGSSNYESHSDMAGQSENGKWTNGDKWIMLAEGAWPEHSLFQDDYSKMAKMSQEQRWRDLLWTSLGIWPDINESDVLYRGNKDQEDTDKHLCPLPRSIIKRAIELYSLPGETVFTPFSGSGTALDQAIRLGRKIVAIELKPEYFNLSVKNADLAVQESLQLNMWDFMGV